jgi:ketosteroid isomerase-like protein
MAVDLGTYHVEFPGPDGTMLSDDGKYSVVWVKENGEWKVFADIFNSDMPLE